VADFGFCFETRLAAAAEEVWAHAMTIEGVNRELWPLARMTAPPDLARLDAPSLPMGRRLLRSWILAFGVLPVDYDDVTLVELTPGRRFLERSPMLTQRLWEHEREVVPEAAGGCLVRDRVRFEPRSRLVGRVQFPVFRLVFRNRHRRLVALFGAASGVRTVRGD
jgi:ligand-binding SRPBCC domain-containing protein